ncbi:hypothetical protein ABZW30_07980 [Kitasatospora sp. NPDC004669]|uniref:hypothetical protein n=1 Tax=Kitasatospora sp. NPDC004669 TaxID=3154555 RepID=UPI0033A49B4D
MARIRTVKPEFFTSDSLSRVSLTAERTFCGIFSLVDDRGRFRDDARVIYGRLWVTRTEQTLAGVEDDLRELAAEGLICRYVGCDGKRYLHPVTWLQHQKISNRTDSRLPACPEHHADLECGGCKDEDHCIAPAPENFRRAAETLSDTDTTPTAPTTAPCGSTPTQPDPPNGTPAPKKEKSPGQDVSAEILRSAPEPLSPGSRIQDPGSTPNGGGCAAPNSTSQLIAEYKSWFNPQPPRNEVARIGKEIKALVEEGFAEEHIREGLREFAKLPGMGPTLLPSLVHAAATGRLTKSAQPAGPGRHKGWTNPNADAYAEEL